MKRLIVLALLVLGILGLLRPSSAFFFDRAESRTTITTQALNLQLADAYSVSQILPLDVAVEFGYSLSFLTDAEVALDITCTFGDPQIDDSALLFLYPSTIANAQIYADVHHNNAQNSLRAPFALTQSLKIFLYSHPDLLADIERFEDRVVTITISASASMENWYADALTTLELQTPSNLIAPVITLTDIPNVYFVGDTEGLLPEHFATAFDMIDGDLTSQMTVESVPQFDPDRADTYTLTFNVTSSAGLSAIPIVTEVVIWDFVKLASGNYHTLALTSHGDVYSWGYNSYGQLGYGGGYSSVPTRIAALPKVVDIAAGTNCSFAVTADGGVLAWGQNLNGRLGDGTTTSKSAPTAVKLPTDRRFVSVSAQFRSAGAVTADGEAYIWGYGGYGAMASDGGGDQPTPKRLDVEGVAQLAMGYYNGAVVTTEGRLLVWGDNANSQLAMSGGRQYNPIEVPFFADKMVASVSVGWYHMGAVTTDGRLFTWGYGASGRLGSGTTETRATPFEVELGARVTSVKTAYYHSGALTEDGRVFFFGQNAYGKHGTGSTTNNLTPVALALDGMTDFSLALDTSFVLQNGSVVFGMGYGGTGILGNNASQNKTTPTEWHFVPHREKTNLWTMR